MVRASPRVQSLVWRLAHDIFPINVMLAQRGVQVGTQCVSCEMEEETSESTHSTSCQYCTTIRKRVCLRQQCRNMMAKLRQSVVAYAIWEMWLEQNASIYFSRTRRGQRPWSRTELWLPQLRGRKALEDFDRLSVSFGEGLRLPVSEHRYFLFLKWIFQSDESSLNKLKIG